MLSATLVSGMLQPSEHFRFKLLPLPTVHIFRKKQQKNLNGWHNWIPRTQFSMQSEYFCTLVDTLGSVDTLKIDCCTLYSFSPFFLFCLWLPQNVSGCKMRMLPRRMCNVPHEMRLVGASPRIIYAISNLQKATKNCPTKYVYMYTYMYIYLCAA